MILRHQVMIQLQKNNMRKNPISSTIFVGRYLLGKNDNKQIQDSLFRY